MQKLSTLGEIPHLPVYAARSLEQRPDFMTLTIVINDHKNRKSRTFVLQMRKLRPGGGPVPGKRLLSDLQRHGEIMQASRCIFRAWLKIGECTGSSLQSLADVNKPRAPNSFELHRVAGRNPLRSTLKRVPAKTGTTVTPKCPRPAPWPCA